ncbi:peptidase [Massilia arenosa]|uniref:Peptidase n=1 Tax=Zemynaea arenosa TaxID=2561931 RepID=A0A4Y9SCM3_9BURK|nr:PA domain-containing protein [Massilia arenosa]TFW20172.1 peptidase [Massilia arenosa]
MTPAKFLAGLAACATIGSAQAAATITIINANAPGVGFNDTTAVAPVGGNPGTTLGAQRLFAFTYAANLWAANIDSPIEIRIQASFEPLSCTASAAVLGSAGTADIFANFTGAPKPNTWYPSALASKLANADLAGPPAPHIVARFNSRLGLFADCLPGTQFYLGVDNNHGANIDLVTVLLHEMAHGLGFQSFTSGQTGEQPDGLASIWDYFLLDDRTGKHWIDMTNAERVSSAVSGNQTSWDGPNVSAAVPDVLAPRSNLAVSGPAADDAAGNYEVGDASFGPPLGSPAVTGQIMPVVDQPGGTGLACDPLNAVNALAVNGNIALVDRGTCNFTVKARNVQDAGAIGMIVVDNAPGPVTGLGGTDPTVTIPAVRISQADGNHIKLKLLKRSRTASGVIGALGVDPTRLAGADAALRALMYTPVVYEPGSSVSHYTTDMKPNQLMEPSINGDLSHEVKPPRDLTLPLLKDIGW